VYYSILQTIRKQVVRLFQLPRTEFTGKSFD